MITINEIARLANLSVATVSRAINDTGKVAPKTKEKIQKIIDEYGYEPNMFGKNLRKKETKLILVIITTIVNSFYSKVVDSIDKAASKYGYNVILCATNDNPQKEQAYLKMLKNGFCDGCIILNTTMDKSTMHEFLLNNNAVQCNEYIDDDYPYIAIDNRQAAYDAVSYLIKTGRRKIAYCGVENNFISSRLRHLGYYEALKDGGIQYNEDIVFDGNYGFRMAKLLTDKMIEEKKEFDSLFAISDRMAAGAMHSMQEKNLKIPQDVAVMGFDNIHLSYMITPSLSTVAQPQEEMGEMAFMALLERLSGKQYDKKIIKHKLLIRNSTDKI